ncbi:zinc finger protein 70-like [Ischnura elegans]|uniref:zinc finger protein 70-like n=1 Tax=Ischnura elegans TaxID=197161 RepID=UPI001ED88F0E|nr:zinc finger protein 70-like [Ischnura elegans]
MGSRSTGRKTMKVEKTCRLCMRDREYYLSIFPSNDVSKISIGKAIQELLNLEISEDDGLPGTVCRTCFAKLVDFRAFKDMCTKSARELRKRLREKTVTYPVEAVAESVPVAEYEEEDGGGDIAKMESRVPAETDDASDPLAEENQKEPVPSGAQEEDNGGEDEGATGSRECYGGTAVYIECTPLVLPDQVHVKEEPMEEDEGEAGGESEMGQDHSEWGEGYKDEDYASAAGSHVDADPQDYGQMNEMEENADLVHDEEAAGEEYAEEGYQDEGETSYDYSAYGYGSQAHCSSDIGNDQERTSTRLSDFAAEGVTPDSSQSSSYYGGSSSKSQPPADADPSLKPFVCGICGKGFSRKSYLRNHSVIHSDTKAFKCEVCGKEFNQKAHLNTHAVVHTGLKPFKCETCGKEYNRMDSLKTHQLIHSGLKPYKCETCGKAFHDRSNLRSHSALHSNKREFKCEVCGVEFNQRGNLKKHEAIHTGIRPFKCEVCFKEFMLKDILQKHMAIHTGLRPFKCEICGKEFNRRDSLKTHAVIHTGLKPFVCDVCGKDFNDKRNLKTHKTIHLENRAFKCETCGKTYKTPASLKNHVALHT